MSRTVGPAQAAIFAAQLLMLDDPLLAARADELIRTERINADWALERAIAELHEVFAREGDAWLRERVGDLADVGGRLQRNLRPGRDPLVDLVQELEPPLILVADELPPSVAAQLDWTRVRGLVCDVGSPTHHTVILARSLGVPAVVGLGGATQLIAPGQMLAIDGDDAAKSSIEPTEDVLERWRAARRGRRPPRCARSTTLRDAAGGHRRRRAHPARRESRDRRRSRRACATPAPKASASIDPSSCSTPRSRTPRPRTRRSRPIARCSRRCGRCR